MEIRVLIVDDEALARERIRSLLDPETGFRVVGEAENGSAAAAAVRELSPDLVFLDIQMPGLDGFGVVEEVGVRNMPLTVFVTAFDQHALRAFDVHALDYLLKPFDRERFLETLGRVRDQLSQRNQALITDRLEQVLQTLNRGSSFVDQFTIRTGVRHTIVHVEDVNLITSEGNYLRLHTAGKSYLLREQMGRIEEQLDPGEFVRIHRSTIVRTSLITEVESVFQGEYVVILRDGTRLGSSRGCREKLERAVRIVPGRDVPSTPSP
ncbi:MAG TPA: LytTR family DNA-binding domain-containing protein [Longimicrobium sp.]|jgi:two-component system LytT family response regulator|uniref:LytR/AlgR family response regulator transcription factor n=1 Tax=Longimicrobium sp. TaxID=2029185 RepID=UPI002EDA7256